MMASKFLFSRFSCWACSFVLITVSQSGIAGTDDYSDAQLSMQDASADHLLELGTSFLSSANEADWARGLLLLEQAAARGIPVCLLIADAYKMGVSGTPDLEKAQHWYRIAAESGDAHAQLALGKMYLNGDGVKRDVVQAIVYLQLAFDHLRKNALKAQAEAALMRAKSWIGWDEWQEAKELLDNWQPKTLRDLLN